MEWFPYAPPIANQRRRPRKPVGRLLIIKGLRFHRLPKPCQSSNTLITD